MMLTAKFFKRVHKLFERETGGSGPGSELLRELGKLPASFLL